MRIAVLLATYNGEAFIEEQVQSILKGKPEDAEITLFISDDNSTDGTLEAVNKITPPKNVEIVIDSNTTGKNGYVCNFNNTCTMASNETFDIYFFSDQDDIWHDNKLTTMCLELNSINEQHPDTPVLVHSDLRVVDVNGAVIANSFVQYQGLPPPEHQSHVHFLHQNVATGCTFAFNHQLFNLAYPIPDVALVHDWWFALVARYYGVIYFLDTPLLDYRQHFNNAIGATNHKTLSSIFNPKFLKVLLNYPNHLKRSIQQAKLVVQLAPEKLEPHAIRSSEEYIEIEQLAVHKRIQRCLKILGAGKTFKEKLFLTAVALVLKSLPHNSSR